MAYITKEEVAAIRKELKETFPTIKFSVTKEHSSSVTAAIVQSSEFDFTPFLDGREYGSVNAGWVDVNYRNKVEFEKTTREKFIRIVQKIDEILHNAPARAGLSEWFDKSDIMTDYFHTAWYTHVHIGKWNKPYKFVQKEVKTKKSRVWIGQTEYVFPNEFDAHGFATEAASMGYEVILQKTA